MNSNNNQLYTDIVNKCWEDNYFKHKLIKDPVETICQEFGKVHDASDGKQFVVIDQTDANVININIPARPSMNDLELSDAQLENISGGGSPALFVAWSSYGCLATVATGVGLAIAYFKDK